MGLLGFDEVAGIVCKGQQERRRVTFCLVLLCHHGCLTPLKLLGYISFDFSSEVVEVTLVSYYSSLPLFSLASSKMVN